MIKAGVEALQESTATEELVESTTIEELESTVRTASAGVVAEKKGSRFHDEGLEEVDESVEELDGSEEALSNPTPIGGSGRAAHGGEARRGGPGRMGRRRVCSRRTQPSLVPSRASKTTVLNNSSEARTKEILCKPWKEQNPCLTCGWSVVYQREE